MHIASIDKDMLRESNLYDRFSNMNGEQRITNERGIDVFVEIENELQMMIPDNPRIHADRMFPHGQISVIG